MAVRASSKIQSAGLLLFRQRGKDVQVLLGHPGGPFWSRKDHGAWTIPKGLIGPGESLLSAAQREFAEETGYRPDGKAIALGSAQQPGGKVVHVWAIEEDWDPADLRSNTFEMEWPPRSGRRQSFPELDRASWFGVAEARLKILKGQAVFLDYLLEILGRADGS
ncbi:NUDIX domain-containing protein [Bradyrhizobium sp. CSA112]|uniref:NUDIX domain-containing protein n=1 Tax=Bradyrhizobium sp. CSA112 TaxID=2699170 RepID=UPI0023B0ECE2|nr:NUDIX domain-containing protein [Bradyrhizobium sp. CSA112]MDE5454239.1 NUDIX domain-containing protein [Bradyrhizobium sp. CSA112]